MAANTHVTKHPHHCRENVWKGSNQHLPVAHVRHLFQYCPFTLRRALTGIKIRLKGAQRGHSLLKKKSDALTLRFRAVLKQIIKVIFHRLYQVCLDVVAQDDRTRPWWVRCSRKHRKVRRQPAETTVKKPRTIRKDFRSSRHPAVPGKSHRWRNFRPTGHP